MIRRLPVIAISLVLLLTVGVWRTSPQSGLLVQEAVIGTAGCTRNASVVTCTFPSNVTSGNSIVMGIIVKRQAGTVTWTKSDTMNITGTPPGWQCSIAGPNVPQGITGEICVGFPTSTGPEAVTFTETSGDLSVANAFVSEWRPGLFSPCGSACTFLDGPDPNCCLSPFSAITISTTAASGYVNNFSIASLYATFPNSCSAEFWTTPSSGAATLLDPANSFIAYAFQPNTSGSVVSETMNCGSGNSGSIVWGGVIFSSTYAPTSGRRVKGQEY